MNREYWPGLNLKVFDKVYIKPTFFIIFEWINNADYYIITI